MSEENRNVVLFCYADKRMAIQNIEGIPHRNNKPSIHDIHTVKKHYVIEIYAAIMEGKKSSSAISLRLKLGVNSR